MATSESDKLKRFQKNMFRVGKVVSIAEHIDRGRHFEAVRTARALAIAGLPKRPCQTRDLSRTLRVGANLWLRVTYTAQEGHDLPFGEDRFVLAGIQHLALEQDSPTVLFARVGSLLKTQKTSSRSTLTPSKSSSSANTPYRRGKTFNPSTLAS